VRAETLRALLAALDDAPAALLIARLADPRGYGRVVRDLAGRVARLIEEAELRPEQRDLNEVVGGALAFRAGWLREHLGRLRPHPNDEYYLTDLIGIAADTGAPTRAVECDDPAEAVGINDRLQLADAHRIVYERERRRLLLDIGVSMPQPESVFVEPGVVVGRDCVLLPNTFLRGSTRVGESCVIGPSSELVDTVVGDGCRVAWSLLEQATLADDVRVGPFSHLRPGARLQPGVRLGNYVEVKNSVLGAGTHAGHFSYLGDAELGERVNVGAGTVTCNFDGRDKHRTVVGDGAFIGSDTMLIAPVRLGDGARTGAGSVVTRDVDDGQTVVGVPAREIPRRGHPASPSQAVRDGVARPAHG
jgi:bifunctional UDP-N-acetylglucosamine pyrophosphorylase/glucosamine-1-phosphate N-acetyltransferase